MNYKTGDIFEVHTKYMKGIIKLGYKYPPKKGKSTRWRIILISGHWVYRSISAYTLDGVVVQKLGKGAEVFYGK